MEGFDGKDGLPKLNALLKDAGYSATADPKIRRRSTGSWPR